MSQNLILAGGAVIALLFLNSKESTKESEKTTTTTTGTIPVSNGPVYGDSDYTGYDNTPSGPVENPFTTNTSGPEITSVTVMHSFAPGVTPNYAVSGKCKKPDGSDAVGPDSPSQWVNDDPLSCFRFFHQQTDPNRRPYYVYDDGIIARQEFGYTGPGAITLYPEGSAIPTETMTCFMKNRNLVNDPWRNLGPTVSKQQCESIGQSRYFNSVETNSYQTLWAPDYTFGNVASGTVPVASVPDTNEPPKVSDGLCWLPNSVMGLIMTPTQCAASGGEMKPLL